MQNDTVLPPDQRRNYKNVIDAFSRIIKEEGFTALWKGAVPTACRAMSLNLGMLAPYDEAKERLQRLAGTKQDTLGIRLAFNDFIIQVECNCWILRLIFVASI